MHRYLSSAQQILGCLTNFAAANRAIRAGCSFRGLVVSSSVAKVISLGESGDQMTEGTVVIDAEKDTGEDGGM